MEKRPLIGILVANSYSRRKVLQLYHKHHDIQVKLFAFTPADIRWKARRIVGLTRRGGKWQENVFPFPAVIYNRCYTRKSKVIQRLKSRIGSKKCFNVINHLNKWTVYQVLHESFLQSYVPESFLYQENSLHVILEKYKLLYLKPYYGNRGRGVYRLEQADNGEIHLSTNSLAPSHIYGSEEDVQEQMNKLIGKKKKEYMIQQGIRSSLIGQQLFDIRALVQKNIQGDWTVTSTITRVAYPAYYNTSIYDAAFDFESLCTRLFPSNETVDAFLESIRSVSVNVAQLLEYKLGTFGEVSVDFVLDQAEKLWIIEVNGSPQKNIYEDIQDFQHKSLIYRRPIEFAYYLANS